MKKGLTQSMSEIALREKFEQLVQCPICLEQMKNPKVFPCLHSYCHQCIVNLSDKNKAGLTCPECRVPVKINGPADISSLPSNCIANNILATLALNDDTKLTAIPCDNCDEDKPFETRCRECLTFLCHVCTEAHKRSLDTKSHSLLSKDEVKTNKPSDNARIMKCNKHPGKVIELYCESCQTTICMMCSVVDHKYHNILPVKESAGKTKKKVDRLLQDVKARRNRISTGLENVEKMTRDIDAKSKATIDEINTFFTQLEQEIRTRKQHLINRENLLVDDQKSQLQALNEELEVAQSTCNRSVTFAEQALENGNDVQVLGMKQTITESLETLKGVQDAITRNVGDPVRFINDLSIEDIVKLVAEKCSVEKVVICLEKSTARIKLGTLNDECLHVGEKSIIEIVCKDKHGRRVISGKERDQIEPSFLGVEVSDVEVIQKEDGSHVVAFVANQLGTLIFEATINGCIAPGCSLKQDVRWKLSNAHGCGCLATNGFKMTCESEIGKYCYRLGNWSMSSGIHKWKVQISHSVQKGNECKNAAFEVGVIENSDDYSEESVQSGKTKKWVYSESSNKILYAYVELDMNSKRIKIRARGKIVPTTSKFSLRHKTFEITSEKVFPFFSVNCPHCTLTF